MNEKLILAHFDDKDYVLDYINQQFKNYDWEVSYSGRTGDEALEVILKYEPHLVLLDISMPGISVFEILRIVQKKSLKSKIVFLTDNQDKIFYDAAKELGAAGYIYKDNDISEIIDNLYLVISEDNWVERLDVDDWIDGPLLTEKDISFLKYKADGCWLQEFADKEVYSKNPVKYYAGSVQDKYNVPSVNKLIKLAYKFIK